MQQEKNYRYAPVCSGNMSGSQRMNRNTCAREYSGDTCSRDCGDRTLREREYEQGNCINDCGDRNNVDMVLGMAYVRSQPFENLYELNEGWCNGTIFRDLNLPYGGYKS